MQQFVLKLCQPKRAGLLGFGGVMAAFTIAAVVTRPLPTGDGNFVVAMLVGLLGCYGVYRLVRKVAVQETLVTVEPEQVTVTYLRTNQQLLVAFVDVVSYRDELLRNGRELRFRLRSGQKVKLVTNEFLGATGDYDGLLRAVETAIANYKVAELPTGALPIVREKSFYESLWAKLLLAVAGLLVLAVFTLALLKGKPLTEGVFTLLGAVLSYAGLWYAARQRAASKPYPVTTGSSRSSATRLRR